MPIWFVMKGVLLLLICLLLLSRFSDAQTEKIIKFQDTCKPLNQDQTELIQNSSVYRHINGSYNNPINISWGVTNTTLLRVMPANYGGPNGTVIRATDGSDLPNARHLTTSIFPYANRPSKKYTLVTMQWGQVVAHDMSLSYNTAVDCCADPNADDCMTIKIPPNDPFYSQYNQTCINMVRTIAQLSGSIREQISTITHHIDASFLYGSDVETANALRQFKGGLLKVYITKDGREFLPLSNNTLDDCGFAPPGELCFTSGDIRTDQNIQLTTLLVVILREHNRIARALSEINPCWDDERLYQESRRIVGAIVQHITYKEWLPEIIGGTHYARKKNLLPLASGYSDCYNLNVNPTTINSFTTVAYRLFHSAIQGQLWMVNSGSKCPYQKLNMSDYMNRPGLLTQDNYLDGSLNGLRTQPMQKVDRFYTEEANGKMFHFNLPYGLDLTSIDIQRARDHGMPFYNEMRKYAGLCEAKRFEDLVLDLGVENVDLLKTVYSHVNDIDAFVGCSLEKPVNNCLIGPTARRLIVEQFSRKKFGDRFWYENGNMPNSFTLEQLDEIRKVSLSRILCDNGDNITKIQRNSFQLTTDFGFGNEVVKCSQIPAINLTKWIESPPC